MTSIKRFLGKPQDTRWLNRLHRLLTVAGFGSVEEQSKQLSGWDVTVCARANGLPGGRELQVVTLYSFDYFGVQGIASVVLDLDKDVESSIARFLVRAGFFPYGSPKGLSITCQLAQAGFTGRDGLGHDLVHPQFLNGDTGL